MMKHPCHLLCAAQLLLLATVAGCDSLSGDEVVWIPIPAGSFMMGCPDGEPECGGFNGLYGGTPRHLVNIQAFEMTRTEITQSQYWKVTGKQPSYHPTCGECPVEYMQDHYQSARAFCAAIGGRLPSEAEWEYAAQAGSTTRFICGDNVLCLEDIAWHAIDFDKLGVLRHPQPVGQKLPNAFGLYDMFGNLQEWTEDCSHDDYVGAPTDGSAWMSEDGGDCSRHVFKGSSYNTDLSDDVPHWEVQPSGRFWDGKDTRGIADGFRCARDAQQANQ